MLPLTVGVIAAFALALKYKPSARLAVARNLLFQPDSYETYCSGTECSSLASTLARKQVGVPGVSVPSKADRLRMKKTYLLWVSFSKAEWAPELETVAE
mmetsp:Transcript_49041/g.106822  ORF Transcript_49041/g.106822 Transcript_49041/m.106822 type:complete len:99 (+) Transcript_49041:49-345(+)